MKSEKVATSRVVRDINSKIISAAYLLFHTYAEEYFKIPRSYIEATSYIR